MTYPLIDPHIIADLRLVHALLNSTIIVLFFYQGWLGLTIRRARLSGGPLPFPVIRRHRRLGPIVAGLGLFGFSFGATLVMIHTGKILDYPYHLATGIVIIILIVTTVLISRRIKGPDSPYRTPHFVIGALLLFLYLVEAFLGIGALF